MVKKRYDYIKRGLDILFSSFALIIFGVISIPVLIILKFTGEGKIFYIQERVGYKGKMFGLLKFATMLKDSPNIGTGSLTIDGDPRVLPVGKFLRKYKLNEIPQFINVVRGDMSMVGPRPLVLEDFKCYQGDIQEEIKEIKPGLTGIGSVVFRSEEEIYSKVKNNNPRKTYIESIAPLQ